MKWCCSAFEGHFENAGKRGLAVFADTSGQRPHFVMQFRAVDGPFDAVATKPVSSVVDVLIRYCPWCGEELRKAYSGNISELSRNELRVPL